jgi:bifunctional ADP-heptose synthase (sugar kinase/adenylyltransferase)
LQRIEQGALNNMDTRRKILTPAEALEVAREFRAGGTPITLISGTFDVLQPDLIRKIAAARRPLFALVLDPPAPLLTAQARTELAAALQMIDYVIYSSSQSADFIASLAPDQHIRAEEEHLATRQRLIRHVLERHNASAAGGQAH